MQGNKVVAKSFAAMDVKHCFGVIGVPVIELGYALQGEGIEYYGFRNEQAASYGASAIGYMTQKPGLCLVVSGPGLVHALAGAANAQTNGWPLVILAGSSEISQQGMGGFQEFDQMAVVKSYVKFSAKIVSLAQAPQLIEQAVRISMVGRPGCVYIEIPGDMLRQTIDPSQVVFPQRYDVSYMPVSQATEELVRLACIKLSTAQNPLVIVGKACAMSRAETAVREFIDASGLPFLPTPMGKGVVPDEHPNNISPARSIALGQADVVVLVGARMNWMLHFGAPPRFRKDVKIIQLDICPEEFNTNVSASINLMGNIKDVVQQLSAELKKSKWRYGSDTQWWSTLKKKSESNKLINKELMEDKSLPLQYYSSIGIITQYISNDAIVIGEGSNTMDIGRTIIQHQHPRSKLDSGTFATMGVGLGYCIAAKIINPKKQVIAVVGDSAFGFSAMELETATRYNLPITVIIINNNGVFMGVEELPTKNQEIPVTALNPNTAYEKLGEAFGAKGFLIETHEQLHSAMKEVVANPNKSFLLNVKISPLGQKKPQEHAWLTQSKL